MKKTFITALNAAAMLLCLVCCNKSDEGGVLMEGIVTVKTSPSKACYLQLDDNIVLKPTNMSTSPFSEPTRTLVLFVDYGKSSEPFDVQGVEVRTVDINDMRKILTKKTVESEGIEVDAVKYGNDPMDIVNMPYTVVEDGFITICFRSLWGSTGNAHIFNLVRNVDPQDPYLFELRQNFNGDIPTVGKIMFGYVAFDISDIISDKTKTYNISVRHIGSDGVLKTARFVYKFGTSAFLEQSTEFVPETTLSSLTSNIQ